jgi:hypothetical protein
MSHRTMLRPGSRTGSLRCGMRMRVGRSYSVISRGRTGLSANDAVHLRSRRACWLRGGQRVGQRDMIRSTHLRRTCSRWTLDRDRTESMRSTNTFCRTSRTIFLLTCHSCALSQGLYLPFQLLDPTMRLHRAVPPTRRTLFLGQGRNILHRRWYSNKSGSRERRGGHSRHDNMRGGVVYPEISKVQGRNNGTREA